MRTIKLPAAGRPARSRPDQIFLTPHRRAARAVGADYRTLDREALERLAASGWSLASPIARQRALRESVFEVTAGPDPVGMAKRLRGGVETLLRIDADLNSLLDDESERIRELARVSIGYRRRLDDMQMVDPAESLWRAARIEQPRRPLLIHGYFRPRIDELALIDALAGDGSEILLPYGKASIFNGNTEAIDFLCQRGWAVADGTMEVGGEENLRIGDAITWSFVTGSGAEEDVARLWSYPTIEAEVRGVLAEVKQLLAAGVTPGEIVLVTNDEAGYGPPLLATGWEYDLPVRVLYDAPLSQSRFGSWVGLMVESVAGGFAFEPTLQFLAHPLSVGIDAKMLGALLRAHPAGRQSWMDAGFNLSLPDWPDEDERQVMIDHLLTAMKSARVPLDQTDLLVQDRLRAGLGEMTGQAADGDRRITSTGLAREVGELLGQLTIPAQVNEATPTDREMIELHQPEFLFGSRYRHVFVLGMIEGGVPRPIIEDPVLDLHDRKRLRGFGLRLESATDLAHREELGFCLVARSAEESLTFSFPRLKGGAPTLPSAYLQRLGLTARRGDERGMPPISIEEWRIEHLTDGTTKPVSDPALERIRHSYSVELSREVATSYDEYDGMVGESIDADARLWSASQMTCLGQCPFQWFSRYVLGISDPGELPEEITPRQIGTLFHRVLELALENIPPDVDPREYALARIDDALRLAESDPSNPFPKYPAWRAQRREYLASLRRAINSPEFIRQDAVVIGCEEKFEGEWEGLRVTGFIDRIDRSPEGVELIDYKTSSQFPKGAQDDSGALKVDLQIPIYTESAGASLFPGEAVTGRYYSLNKARNLVQAGRKTDGGAGGEQLRNFAVRLRERLRQGRFPVEPDVEGKACEYCEFDPICRKGPRLAHKDRQDHQDRQERMAGE